MISVRGFVQARQLDSRAPIVLSSVRPHAETRARTKADEARLTKRGDCDHHPLSIIEDLVRNAKCQRPDLAVRSPYSEL